MIKRYEVFKKVKEEWVFVGCAKSVSREEAITIIKRYLLEAPEKEWRAQELKITKR